MGVGKMNMLKHLDVCAYMLTSEMLRIILQVATHNANTISRWWNMYCYEKVSYPMLPYTIPALTTTTPKCQLLT